jgi:Oxygenase domain of the 2OGFeDO superfamily
LSPKKRSNGSWRDHHPENEGVTGIVNLSPGWFSQGHEGPEDPLHASADIQEPANSTYLQHLVLANAIVGAIYAIIQPDLFESGLAAFEKLADHAEALDDPINIALRVWATPFTGLSVILNRETIDHRDLKGYRESFDLLLTIGNYKGGRCHLAGLGFSLVYDPGTVVALAGNVLQHGVCPVLGDRACLAHFWHKKVGERLGVKRPQWLTMADLIYNFSSN